jgi:fucose permease
MTTPEPSTPPGGAARDADHALRAGLVAGLAYVLIGWRALLVPSLIRLIAPAFGQGDAGMGGYFLATSVAYGIGSLTGGRLAQHLRLRVMVPVAIGLMAAALAVQGLTGSWMVFATFGFLASLAGSIADVGITSLVLDLFASGRSRALNLLHVSYGTGALLAPIVLSALVGAGIGWQWLIVGTGVALAVSGVGLFVVIPPHPVLVRGAATEPARDGVASGDGSAAGAIAAPVGGGHRATDPIPGPERRVPRFLIVLAVAIACYVAAEAGTSNWLVRYLAVLPQAEASLALTLFWGGIAAGRLVVARLGNRLEPQATTAVLGVAGGVLLLGALLAPVGPWSPLLFGAVGLAFGPIFPTVVAAAGTRMPMRSSTATSALIFAGVLGAVIYPPMVGFLSDTIGLGAGMLGAAALSFLCGVAAWLAIRVRS